MRVRSTGAAHAARRASRSRRRTRGPWLALRAGGLTMVWWIHAALALASLGSILVGRPWTIPLARRHTPPEVWATALFLETNVMLTAAWAVLFAGGAGLALTAPLWVQLP